MYRQCPKVEINLLVSKKGCNCFLKKAKKNVLSINKHDHTLYNVTSVTF